MGQVIVTYALRSSHGSAGRRAPIEKKPKNEHDWVFPKKLKSRRFGGMATSDGGAVLGPPAMSEAEPSTSMVEDSGE